jgi:pyruvate/2-oxoglutarate/acetoin dehydrogenase E1 component
MALRGLRPVVELMFGDFITLAADQIINHIAKFRWMYNNQVSLPLVVRTPMGGRRGYGPTHSQTLEKHFLGVPGLRVVAPCALQGSGPSEQGAGDLLQRLILESSSPTLFIENKLLYLKRIQSPSRLADFILQVDLSTLNGFAVPVYTLRMAGAPAPTLSITAYGYMAELARQAVLRLAYEHEIFTELVVFTGLSPFDARPVIESARRTGCLLAVEEGSLTLGWGAEVIALCAETLGARLEKSARLAALDLPVPASGPLEETVLPGLESIIARARSLV